ncbi:MAG: hypothetical protein LIP06_07565 [Tannerellaceae bacterium]|nr:hypothetical protein [Tannerellaceae bacterium]
MKVINYIFLLLFVTCRMGIGQNVMTSSPYSMFGLGEVSYGLYGQNAAMGGVSYGMRDKFLVNIENPAGLTGLDSMKLFAETSAFIKSEHYTSKGSSNNAFTGNVSAFLLGGRLMPRWYMAVGLSPYTSVGYYFKSSQTLEGTANSTSTSLFQGDGGLSKVSLSNGFLLTKNLSIGVNVSYIFGNLYQTETQDAMIIKQQMYTQMIYPDFGLQYERALDKEVVLTVGAVYGYKQKLKLDNTITVTTTSTSNEYTQRKVTQYLPQYIGAGGSLAYKRWVYALDYTFYEYSAWSSGDNRIKFTDSHEVKAGISFLPENLSYSKFIKKIIYKAGVNISTPYYKISGQTGINWRANAGFSFPIANGYLHTGFFYDRLDISRNTLQRDLIGLTVSYTLGERFHRVKL